jgi:hypothetical protein
VRVSTPWVLTIFFLTKTFVIYKIDNMELNEDDFGILVPLLTTHLVEVEKVNPYDERGPLPPANQLLKRLLDERERLLGLSRAEASR